MLLIVMKSFHPTLIKIDSGTRLLTLNKLNYVGLIRKITICSTLQIVQSLKSAEFEVSDLRGPSCTRVLFDVYDGVIVLIPLSIWSKNSSMR